MDAYGTGTARGSWALLAPTRCVSPILNYKNGKYLKAAGRWVAADRLLYHTGIELEAAREKASTAAAAASQAAVEAELDTACFPVGARVFAKGFAPSGRDWFIAQVIGHRNRAPPLSIKYLATHPDGETSPLALPIPRQAFVYASDVQTDMP